MRFLIVAVYLVGCGDSWTESSLEEVHRDFPMTCGHATATCDSCHGSQDELAGLDPACLTCHEADRPASHDPVATADCAECHTACGWFSASPHPAGFSAAEAHGVAFSVQDPTEGDCRECHGTDLAGGSAVGCDDCHADAGHSDWRSDCTFCHGGTDNPSGAPPHEIDGTSVDPSFRSHSPHVEANESFHAIACVECHPASTDILDATHIYDGTPGVSEVDFSGGISPTTLWNGSTCADNGCHGPGLGTATVADTAPPVNCDTCHATSEGWGERGGSPLHLPHLRSGEIVCSDCHKNVIDSTGNIIDPDRHVNGQRNVDFTETAISSPDNGVSCFGPCHGVPHDGTWGHEAGYDAPEVHGPEALLLDLECRGCHGDALDGGRSGQGCDECHEAGWRSDCTYCHGGANGDTEGLPPKDIDGTTSESSISFMAHPEHADADDHRAIACEECHGTTTVSYIDAVTDVDHWFDSTLGQAEISFTGIAAGATYSGTTCSDLSCHGNGINDGSVSDSNTGLECDECHTMPPRGTEEHRDHNHDRVSCDWCHDSVAGSSTTIDGPSRHVDGAVSVDFSSSANSWGGMTFSSGRCSGTCHAGGDDERHSNERWD